MFFGGNRGCVSALIWRENASGKADSFCRQFGLHKCAELARKRKAQKRKKRQKSDKKRQKVVKK